MEKLTVDEVQPGKVSAMIRRIHPKLPLLALLAVLAALLTPSVAAAQVQTLSVDDPSDVSATLSGTPSETDIKHIDVRFDNQAGSLSIVVEFYRAPSSLDTTDNYAYWATFGLGTSASSGIGCETYDTGSVTGQHHIYSSSGVQFFNQASVAGFDGKMPVGVAASDGGRTLTLTAQNPALMNREYVCFSYRTEHRQYSSVSNPNSRYDSSCDCWYTTDWDDIAGLTGIGDYFGKDLVYFDGFAPVIPKPWSLGQATSTARKKLAKKYGKRWSRGYAKHVKCKGDPDGTFDCSARWIYKHRLRTGWVLIWTPYASWLLDQ